MFFSYFKAYTSRLFKLQMKDSATKEDMLGSEDGPAGMKPTAIGNLFSMKTQAMTGV